MKKTETYNNLPKEVLERYKLPKGQKAIYRLIGIKPDPNNVGRFLIPSYVNVPPQGRVAVQVGKTESDIEYFDVAAISSVQPKQKPKFYEIAFTKQAGGIIEIEGGTALADQLYPYMEMSDYNQSNPLREKSIQPIYYKVDHAKDAAEKRKRRNALKEALDVATGMRDEEILEFADANSIDTKRSVAEVRDSVEALAEKDPVDFMARVSNKQNALKALIKRALSKGVIEFDKTTYRFFWPKSGETICTVSRAQGAEHIQACVDYLVTAKNGSAVLDEIRKLTK